MKELLVASMLLYAGCIDGQKEIIHERVMIHDDYVAMFFSTRTEDECKCYASNYLRDPEVKKTMPQLLHGKEVTKIRIFPKHPDREILDYSKGCVADYAFKPQSAAPTQKATR